MATTILESKTANLMSFKNQEKKEAFIKLFEKYYEDHDSQSLLYNANELALYMQHEISAGKNLEDVFSDVSINYDDFDLVRRTFNISMDLLIDFWKYGTELSVTIQKVNS